MGFLLYRGKGALGNTGPQQLDYYAQCCDDPALLAKLNTTKSNHPYKKY